MTLGAPPLEPDDTLAGPAPHVVIRAICPYLGTGEGWRLAVPDRAHRCLAVSPASALALDKQARLCLDERHRECATFRAAVAAATPERGAEDGAEREPSRPPSRRRWPVPRTHPTVLDVGRGSVDLRSVARERATTQVALVLLALVAFGALVLARVGGSTPAVATAASAPPSGAAQPPGAIATAPLEPTPSPFEAGASSASPPATSPTGRTYVVRAGDTLVEIARRFSTTVKALQSANRLSNANSLRIGQTLVVP